MIKSMRFVLSVLVMACSMLIAQDGGDALLAVIGKEVITMYDLLKYTSQQEAALAEKFYGSELEKRVTVLRREMLENMIDRELIYLEFKELKGQVPKAYLQKLLDDIVEVRAHGDRVRFEQGLHDEGTDIKAFKAKLEKDTAIDMLIHDRVTRGNIISEQEIEEYFKNKTTEFATPNSYKIAVILLKNDGKYAGKIEETRDEIFSKLMSGIAFEDLAKQYSEGANASNGGVQDWMEKPAPVLLAAIQNLKPGQASKELTRIGSSFYMVKLVDKKGGDAVQLTPEIQQKIRKILEREEQDKRYKKFIRELYVKYPVRRLF